MWEYEFDQEVYDRVLREDGEAVGEEKKLITQVCKKMKLGQSLEKIASDLVEEISVIEPIYKAAEKFAPEYAPESILERLRN